MNAFFFSGVRFSGSAFWEKVWRAGFLTSLHWTNQAVLSYTKSPYPSHLHLHWTLNYWKLVDLMKNPYDSFAHCKRYFQWWFWTTFSLDVFSGKAPQKDDLSGFPEGSRSDQWIKPQEQLESIEMNSTLVETCPRSLPAGEGGHHSPARLSVQGGNLYGSSYKWSFFT